MSDDRPDLGGYVDRYPRQRAYESVRAVLSDDHNSERGIVAAQDVIASVIAESGVDGLAEVTIELALRLASALERIAADQGLAAVDLADVCFVD